MSYNDYEVLDPYGNYDDNNEMSPYEMLMRMKAWNKNIYLTVENMDKEIRTQLSILDQEITARIDDFENDVHTQLSMMNGEISSKVSKSDYNGNTIASLINQTATSVKILANKIDLSGYVTISSLKAGGTTEIDGSRITTGYISADRIQASVVLAKLVAAGGISADMITSGTISSSRLDANAIRSKLIEAGGISADYITSGTINSVTINSAIINAGTIRGVSITSAYINISEDIHVGDNIYLGSLNSPGIKTIRFNNSSSISSVGENINFSTGFFNIYANELYVPPQTRVNGIVKSATYDLEITLSTNNNKLLVVKQRGSTLGYIELK